MVDGGYLKPPSENTKNSEIWEETWKRVDRFLPNLYPEIYQEKEPPPAPALPDITEETPGLDEDRPDNSAEGA